MIRCQSSLHSKQQPARVSLVFQVPLELRPTVTTPFFGACESSSLWYGRRLAEVLIPHRLYPLVASISSRAIYSCLECGLVQRSPHHFQARPRGRLGDGGMEGCSRRCGSHRLRPVGTWAAGARAATSDYWKDRASAELADACDGASDPAATMTWPTRR